MEGLLPWRKDLLAKHWELLRPEQATVRLPPLDILGLSGFAYCGGTFGGARLLRLTGGCLDLAETL